jgi:membrane protein DedA with SNARE-associated domain
MQHFIATYGYLAIFLLMVAESACIPVPSELIMTFGGAMAAGAVPGVRLNLILVIIAGVLGNVVGSYIAWAVGRYGGQALVHRPGRHLWLRQDDLDRANRWFDRYGPRAVLIGRVLPVIRTFISLPAGFGGMEPVRFGIYTTIGCIPWTAALAYAGYAVGANWQSIVNGFHGPTYVIAAIVIILVAIWAWRYIQRHRAEAAAEGPGQPAGTATESTGRREGPGRAGNAGQPQGAGRHAASRRPDYGPQDYGPGDELAADAPGRTPDGGRPR